MYYLLTINKNLKEIGISNALRRFLVFILSITIILEFLSKLFFKSFLFCFVLYVFGYINDTNSIYIFKDLLLLAKRVLLIACVTTILNKIYEHILYYLIIFSVKRKDLNNIFDIIVGCYENSNNKNN